MAWQSLLGYIPLAKPGLIHTLRSKADYLPYPFQASILEAMVLLQQSFCVVLFAPRLSHTARALRRRLPLRFNWAASMQIFTGHDSCKTCFVCFIQEQSSNRFQKACWLYRTASWLLSRPQSPHLLRLLGCTSGSLEPLSRGLYRV